MLAALPIEKTAQAWNVLSKEPHVGVEFVMTHLQLAGLQGFIHSFSRYPQEALPVAQYFAAIELAPLIARAFNKLKTLRQDARIWLLKYPETTAVFQLESRGMKDLIKRLQPDCFEDMISLVALF
ncbi:hypothetical protein AAIH16_38815, partial [Pseudomonas aeruginosa]